MKYMKLLSALVVFAGLAPCANAGVTSLGSVGDTTYLLGGDLRGSISDTYNFSLSGLTNLTDAFHSLGIQGFTFDLTGPSGNLGSNSSYSDLPKGSYSFIFSGTVPKPLPFGIYFGHYSATSAVPELDTWLMLLIGGALLAYQLRRRQNALRHSQLATG